MLTFLFWNTGRKNLAENIARLVAQHNIDVIVLAESSQQFRPTLLSALSLFHYCPDDECPRLQIYTRFPSDLLSYVESDDRFRAHRLPLIDGSELLFFACHFISLQHSDEYTLNNQAKKHADRFRQIETRQSHQRAFLVGDLNLNPFAEGIAFEDGFYGLMSKELVRRRERDSRTQTMPYYNPMWSRLGDASTGPPGTYYYAKGGRLSRYFWHTFDQVLLRPSLLDAWQDDFLIQPTDDGVVNFLTKTGIPDTEISDHLPLIFRLNLDLSYEQND